LAVQILNNWFRRDAGRQRFFFHDPLAIAVALDMGIVTTQSAQVAVETFDPVRLGETKVSGRPGPVEVVGPVDQDKFFRLFEEFMRSDPSMNLNPGGSEVLNEA